MKKFISILLLQVLIPCFVFAAIINSKQGYVKVSWGSTVADAKKAGYELTIIASDYTEKLYNAPVEAYKVTSKDKSVSALQFHYYMGKLFLVSETLTVTGFDLKKLYERYGDFYKQGIYSEGKQYTDAVGADGSILNMSIVISNNSAGNVFTTMYDWNIYSVISYAGQKLSQNIKMTTKKKSIVNELEEMAGKLVQEKKGNAKPSYALLSLATDYKNSLVEEYVTDALTEALFNTGKTRIIERANLHAILKEQKLQTSGLVDESTAKSIGMIAGADFICYGTLKDLGDSITVNARVVDVETGELCAIARATVTKDEYLKKRPQAAEGEQKTSAVNTSTKNDTTTTETKTNATTKTTTSIPAANNAWKVTKYRNDFDGYTKFIFRVFSVDERFIFISYKKCDVKANSRVVAGVHWGNGHSWDNTGTFDIKSKEGTVSKYYGDYWRESLDASEKENFNFIWDQKAGSRLLTERFKNNETVAFRRDNLVRNFQTAGLLDKMAEYGITWEEIDAAIANEEF